MIKSLKKTIKSIFSIINLDIGSMKKFSGFYFYKPKEVFFHPALQKVRKTIFDDCPSPMYRESYYVHQIGAWGALPAIISTFREIKRSSNNLESLDIGCAFGTMAAFCSEVGFKASAIDFVPVDIYLGEKTRGKYAIDFHKVLIETEDLPWSNKKFDIITMTEVLEHFHYQPLDVLKKLKTILKDDGLFLVTTPALGQHWLPEYYDCPFEEIPSYNGGVIDPTDKHWKIYGAEELKRLFEKAGFNLFITLNLNINTGNEGFYAVATKKTNEL